jgi:hypothetical protein
MTVIRDIYILIAVLNLSFTDLIIVLPLNSVFLKYGYEWRDRREYERMRREGSFEGSSLVLVGAAHVITDHYKILKFNFSG